MRQIEHGHCVKSPTTCLVTLDEGHLAQAVLLSRSVGWPHRHEDWRLALMLGKGIGLCHGQYLVGTAMTWSWGSHSRVGMLIVHPVYRGQGLGKQLLDELERELGDSVALVATEQGEPLYRQLGFVEEGVVHQCQGRVTNDASDLCGCPYADLRPLEAYDLEAICRFDSQAYGVDRYRLLETLLSNGEGVLALQAGNIVGYALSRPFGMGYVIGPIMAINLRIAKALISWLLARHRGAFVRVDTSDASLAEWLNEHGIAPVSRVASMTRGPQLAPGGPGTRFALSSHALG